jgi:cell division protein FtsQ
MRAKNKLPLRSTGKRTRTTLPAVVPVRRLRPWLYGAGSLLGCALLAAVAIAFDVPRTISLATQAATAGAGFDVAQVEVTGLKHLKRIDVHAAAARAGGGSMLFTDVAAIRSEVEKLPWVKSATVSRQLPDRMAIHIVERAPAALWQRQRRLAVIDLDGRVLETHNLRAFSALPLVVGEGANLKAAGLFEDMEQVPRLRAKVDALIWTGNRRWDVQFKSGDTLQLPEGRDAAQAALTAFAQLDAANGLIGKGLGAFDMRVADRLFIRGVPMNGTNMTQSSAKSDRAI